jgi:hypothetical protein
MIIGTMQKPMPLQIPRIIRVAVLLLFFVVRLHRMVQVMAAGAAPVALVALAVQAVAAAAHHNIKYMKNSNYFGTLSVLFFSCLW